MKQQEWEREGGWEKDTREAGKKGWIETGRVGEKRGRRRRLGEIYERRRKQRLDRNRNSVRGKEGRRKRLGERYERSRKEGLEGRKKQKKRKRKMKRDHKERPVIHIFYRSPWSLATHRRRKLP